MNDLNEKNNMSDVEQEYLRMIDEETPDLWNRIEAGINETHYPEDQGFFEPQEVKEVKKRPKYGLIITGIVAAAAVLFISIFAATGGFERKKNSSRDGKKAYDQNFAIAGENAGVDIGAAESADKPESNTVAEPEFTPELEEKQADDVRSENMNTPERTPEADDTDPAENEAAEAGKTITEDKEISGNSGSEKDKGKGSYFIPDIADAFEKNNLNTGRANADTGAGTAKVLKVGDVAPDFTVDLYGGGTFHMSDYDDRIVVLDFWATWCYTCKEGLPVLAKLENEVPEDVKVLCVELGDPESEVEWVLKEGGYSLTVGLDRQGRVDRYYPSEYIPYMLVIDHGVVAAIVDVYDPNELYPALMKAIEDCRKER